MLLPDVPSALLDHRGPRPELTRSNQRNVPEKQPPMFTTRRNTEVFNTPPRTGALIVATTLEKGPLLAALRAMDRSDLLALLSLVGEALSSNHHK